METDSILDVTKRQCGIEIDDTSYDLEITTHINTVFFVLRSLGVGPSEGFSIIDRTETWSQFIGVEHIHAVRTYMGLKVRMLFDPPVTGPATEAMERQASHLEWLLNIHAEEVKWESRVQEYLLSMESQ